MLDTSTTTRYITRNYSEKCGKSVNKLGNFIFIIKFRI